MSKCKIFEVLNSFRRCARSTVLQQKFCIFSDNLLANTYQRFRGLDMLRLGILELTVFWHTFQIAYYHG